MTKSEKQKYFEKIMTEFQGERTCILKKDISIALGIPKPIIESAIDNLTFFGSRGHYYLIIEVAEALADYMALNTTKEKAKQKNVNDLMNEYDLNHQKLENKIHKLKINNIENQDYWKVS